ncbi:MAG: isocitrate lyase/phosphoenolpyruvate mutase family protein [Gemmatimonadota bacterium]|nr:isocitrate lyase/phosphoenolpyruvate mutase family protein [Gemmatimonadota bacterium]
MTKAEQKTKAEDLLSLHHAPELLVLPNIWDPLGALMLQRIGYPAVATASASIAFSLGYDDGQNISLDTMLEAVGRIAGSVDVPVTADMERGFGERPNEVAENMRRVLRAGAVGVNLEDSTIEDGPLQDLEFQCNRIRAVRSMADEEGIPLVINARTDVFISKFVGNHKTQVAETIRRGKAYLDSGADCFYPILIGDTATLKQIHDAVQAPINVLALANTAPMRELEAIGVSRLSLGPGMMKAGMTAMKTIAGELKEYGSYERFTTDAMDSGVLRMYLKDS